MRIFTKKSFQFDDPAGEQPAVSVQHQSFAVVPDWVADSTMFKLANADGDIEVIGNKQDEKKAELSADEKAARAKAAAEAKALKEKIKNFTALSEDEQAETLQGQEIEPGSSPDERVQQYTELLQKEVSDGHQ